MQFNCPLLQTRPSPLTVRCLYIVFPFSHHAGFSSRLKCNVLLHLETSKNKWGQIQRGRESTFQIIPRPFSCLKYRVKNLRHVFWWLHSNTLLQRLQYFMWMSMFCLFLSVNTYFAFNSPSPLGVEWRIRCIRKQEKKSFHRMTKLQKASFWKHWVFLFFSTYQEKSCRGPTVLK